MMKLVLVMFLGSIVLSAAPIKNNTHLEKLLRDTATRDWPMASRVEVSQVSSKISAPEKAVLMAVNPRPALGAISFELSWQENGQPKSTFGTAIVKVQEPIAIASKNISPGEFLTPENTQLEDREVSRFSKNGIFNSWEDLEDKVAKVFIRSSNVIHPHQVEKPAEIKQGQMVELLHQSPQMTISARMKALDHGRLGQWIRVENQNSKRVVRAKVTAPGRVALQ